MYGCTKSPARRLLVASFLLAVLSTPVKAAAPTASFTWPQGEKAAVSLAYDDALDSQLDNALPALKRHGLKATFYLTLSNPSVSKRLDAWRAAVRGGHELGNHTLFHQCSKKLPGHEWVDAHRDLDTTTAAQMQDQVRLASTFLFAIDGKTERTLTPPCLDLEAAGENYVDALKGEFVAFKAKAGAVASSMVSLDVYAVGADAVSDVTGAQLIARVREAGAKGTMVNLTFHGVGGDYLAVSKEAHEELLRYLADNRKDYWTAPFIEIMRHVRRQQQR